MLTAALYMRHGNGQAKADELALLDAIYLRMNDTDRKNYATLLADREEVTAADLINYAYATEAGQYKLYHDVVDREDAGVAFIMDKYPKLDKILTENLNYEGVGLDLEFSGGRMAENCFILNYDEPPVVIYNDNNAAELLAELNTEQQTGGMSQCLL